MDNALAFFDELKKGVQQQVEQAIEDWDYQDFSPDKRRALLEEQVSNDVADDLAPETGAIQHIQLSRQQLNWSGLSPDDELADYGYGSDAASASAAASTYEDKMVIMSTPAGGIQGVPDDETLHRFVTKAQRMDPRAVTQAIATRLQDTSTCWQIRSKALVLVQALAESSLLAPHYLPLFQQHAALTQQLEHLRTGDHNHVVRENARKALSLVLSNGTNPMHIPKEATSGKAHARPSDSTLASVRKTRVMKKPAPTETAPTSMASAATTKRAMVPPAPIKLGAHRAPQQSAGGDADYGHTSPKIARAALASWRRRQSQEGMSSRDNPNLLPFQTPGKPMTASPMVSRNFVSGAPSSSSMAGAGAASRYQSGQMSAFTFIQ